VNEPVRHLEEKIAYLERHVTEQDKAMLEMAEDIARLKRELKALRERGERSSPGAGDADLPDERPPHY
jgi:SlyX protein